MLKRLPLLSIDFSGRFERERRHALIALVVAFALVAAPVAMFLHVREQTGMLQLQRTQLKENQQSSAAAAEDSRSRRDSEPSAVDNLHAQLARPWDALLIAMEKATVGEVSLMTFQPNAVKGEVVLTGEASRYDEVLKYIDNLRAQPPLTQVFLKTHEIAEDVPGKPVRFTITLLWKSS